MKCPFCGKEMRQGKLRTRGDNYFIPNGCITPTIYTKKSMDKAGAILISSDVFSASYKSNWQTAFLCENCLKAIIDF